MTINILISKMFRFFKLSARLTWPKRQKGSSNTEVYACNTEKTWKKNYEKRSISKRWRRYNALDSVNGDSVYWSPIFALPKAHYEHYVKFNAMTKWQFFWYIMWTHCLHLQPKTHWFRPKQELQKLNVLSKREGNACNWSDFGRWSNCAEVLNEAYNTWAGGCQTTQIDSLKTNASYKLWILMSICVREQAIFNRIRKWPGRWANSTWIILDRTSLWWCDA